MASSGALVWTAGRCGSGGQETTCLYYKPMDKTIVSEAYESEDSVHVKHAFENIQADTTELVFGELSVVGYRLTGKITGSPILG